MIRLLLTHDPLIRDVLAEKFSLVPVPGDDHAWRTGERILVLAESPAEALEGAVSAYAPDEIWLLSGADVISTEHELGDIVLPNAFLPFDDRVIRETLDRENRDAFLHDPVFLSNYEVQSDVDFEAFGLSVGGIAVTVPNYDASLRETVDLAYSADFADSTFYPAVLTAAKLGYDGYLYPMAAIVGSHTETAERRRIFGHLSHVLEYFHNGGAHLPESEEEMPEDDLEDFGDEGQE